MRVFERRVEQAFTKSTAHRAAGAVVGALLLLIPAALLAAEGHGEGHGVPSFGEFLKELVPYWVNFIIYSAIIISVIKKPLINGWASRRKGVADQVEKAAASLRAAQDLLAEAEGRQRAFARNAEALTQEIKKEGEVESARIIEQGELRAKRIVEQARDSAEAERKATYRLFRVRLAEKATALARARLERDTTEDADRLYRQRACEETKELLQ